MPIDLMYPPIGKPEMLSSSQYVEKPRKAYKIVREKLKLAHAKCVHFDHLKIVYQDST